MKKASVVLACALSALYLSAQVSTIRLATRLEGGVARSSTLKIEEREGGFYLSVLDGSGRTTSSASFGPDLIPRQYAQSGADGEKAYSLLTQDGHRLDIRIDGRDKSVVCPEVYAPDGDSQYWFFSRLIAIDPAFGTKEVAFFEPEGARLVVMRIKEAGSETISVAGRPLRALRFDMTLSNAFLRAFWPHVCRYWFSAGDKRFLAYEGCDREGRKLRTEVVE